jgi:hypothetical protein
MVWAGPTDPWVGWGPVGGWLGGRLKAAGYPVWTWIDPSRKGSIESLAHRVGSRLARDVPQGPLMAVTHSLGGIILRHLSRQFECEASVLLAPPNGGARVARRAVGKSMLRWYLGPALQDLAQPRPFRTCRPPV